MPADELKGLPDVDLGPVLDDLKAQQQEPPVKPQVEPPKQDLGQYKSPEEVLKAYKEIQGFATKVSQENKALKEQYSSQLKELQEQLEYARMVQQQQPYVPPPQPQQMQQGFEEPLEMKIDRTVAVREIAGVLQDEQVKNPNEFHERYAFAQMAGNKYPWHKNSAGGVRKLFEEGDKLRTEYQKRSAMRALESIFGGPLNEQEITKLKTMVRGEGAITQQQSYQSNAYMPETSTSTQSGQNQNRMPNIESEINESAKKGDVDGVIKGMFSKLLAE
jgi:hypothetical protein